MPSTIRILPCSLVIFPISHTGFKMAVEVSFKVIVTNLMLGFSSRAFSTSGGFIALPYSTLWTMDFPPNASVISAKRLLNFPLTRFKTSSSGATRFDIPACMAKVPLPAKTKTSFFVHIISLSIS